ncbi:hypothetical protein AB0L00_02430 [Actinoallomurus sp. NPDC052308]|uniref:hypothetical protein n=1 Tax=Actinoallomurus sp. NPDC052308 TaxID=3155530 RepID=UPI00342846F3
MTSPDELMRSVARFRAALDAIDSPDVSAAAELIRLDRLVRRYPEAARKSLELRDRQRGPHRAET